MSLFAGSVVIFVISVFTPIRIRMMCGYLSATMKELQKYADSPYLKNRKPKFVYFGGGTPSYLSAQQLAELTDQMKSIISWDEAEK